MLPLTRHSKASIGYPIFLLIQSNYPWLCKGHGVQSGLATESVIAYTNTYVIKDEAKQVLFNDFRAARQDNVQQ